MIHRKMIYGGIAIALSIIGMCSMIIWHIIHIDDASIIFLDVGQGDAILITQGTHQVLVDGGSDTKVLQEELSRYIPFWDRTIDIVVATHPDSDHIDGLVGVFKNYTVQQFWTTDTGKDTSVYHAIMRAVADESGITSRIVHYGVSADVGRDIKIKTIYPYEQQTIVSEDINESCIAMVVTIGEEKFYLGGDLPSIHEDDLLLDESITVVKAGHHGSSTSTSSVFLEKTRPRDVIISVGEDNRYGHPHAEVLERISESAGQIYRTDKNGSIMYRCKSMRCELFIE